MAKQDSPLYCWDACVFSAFLDEEPGRVEIVAPLMEDAQKGKLRIATSILSITEVAYVALERNGGRVLDAKKEAAIDALWLPPTAVNEIVTLYPRVAFYARELVRYSMSQGWGLKPADAIHLATAKIIGASEFQTYDPALVKYEGTLGLKVCEPHGQAQLPNVMPSVASD